MKTKIILLIISFLSIISFSAKENVSKKDSLFHHEKWEIKNVNRLYAKGNIKIEMALNDQKHVLEIKYNGDLLKDFSTDFQQIPYLMKNGNDYLLFVYAVAEYGIADCQVFYLINGQFKDLGELDFASREDIDSLVPLFLEENSKIVNQKDRINFILLKSVYVNLNDDKTYETSRLHIYIDKKQEKLITEIKK